MNRRSSPLALPYALYALLFILAPVIVIVLYSFTAPDGFTFDHYRAFFDFSRPTYMRVLWRSISFALISTAICLVLGYPMAYILSRMRSKWRRIISFLFVMPMWMNFLLRTYAWVAILENTGIINSLLNLLLRRPAGSAPLLQLMYTPGAIILGNVYNFLPFMILPIYTVLMKLDSSLLEAAGDLGANARRTFLRVVFPLSVPGLMSGITMTFMPAVTTFIISQLLGGTGGVMIGDVIQTQFLTSNWGFGSAMSVILLALVLITMGFTSRYEKENAEGGALL